MNTHTQVLLGVLGIGLAGVTVLTSVGVAQDRSDEPALGQYKIGIVDRKAVYDAYEKRKDEFEELEAEKNRLQEDLDGMLEEIGTLRQQFENGEGTMAEEERSRLSETINSQIDRFTTERERSQRQIDRKGAKLITSLKEEIDLAAQEIGVKGNYHLILDSGQDPKLQGRDVVYYSSTLNMTQKVIDLLNRKYAAERGKSAANTREGAQESS